MSVDDETFVSLTAEIVSAHVRNNSVALCDVPVLIQNVLTALQGLGAAAETLPEKLKGAVSVRASIKPDFLISMIDGKPYKMLRRHITRNGFTADSYREAYGLPKDYPMVAANYSERRRALAHTNGLGRKPKAQSQASAKAPRKPSARKLGVVFDGS